ncbi:hypothetical protein [Streptomyces sp. NPDC001828]|uniref:hypothetical protein n=1 Tax=Streptomyces sp. NPDC001828 TaxID=3364615 RepID=UPI0036934EC3
MTVLTAAVVQAGSPLFDTPAAPAKALDPMTRPTPSPLAADLAQATSTGTRRSARGRV